MTLATCMFGSSWRYWCQRSRNGDRSSEQGFACRYGVGSIGERQSFHEGYWFGCGVAWLKHGLRDVLKYPQTTVRLRLSAMFRKCPLLFSTQASFAPLGGLTTHVLAIAYLLLDGGESGECKIG
jgi:hypothetical protein